MAYNSMAAMMGGGKATAPVPTQSFGASNIIGTPIPQVGDNKGSQNYSGVVGAVRQNHIVMVALAVIIGGYLLYHFNFEK